MCTHIILENKKYSTSHLYKFCEPNKKGKSLPKKKTWIQSLEKKKNNIFAKVSFHLKLTTTYEKIVIFILPVGK